MSDVSSKTPVYEVIFTTNKDKLIELLLNEITFLDMSFYKADTVPVRETIKIALETFENLLKIQGFTDDDLNDEDYRGMRMLVFNTIKHVINSIQSEL